MLLHVTRSCYALILAYIACFAPTQALAKLVWIYQDGEPVAFPVAEAVEFARVPADEIHAANAELLDFVNGYDPQVADLGYGTTKYENDDVHYSEWYTRRRGAIYLKDVAIQDYLSPGDWRGLYGEYFDPGASYFELDKSGPHWSFDARAFTAFGWVYGVEDDELVYNDRRRRQAEVRWRRGSMDGGVWRVNLRAYRVSIDEGMAQPHDVKHLHGDAGFRIAEPDYTVAGAIFQGAYNSHSAQQDNAYAGGRVEGIWWLSDSVSVNTDAKYTMIEAQQQHEKVSRTDAGASLAWELGEFATLSARARARREDSPLAVNSYVTDNQDTGIRLELHPGADVRLAADYRRRELNFERLRTEELAPMDYLELAGASAADELASLREPGRVVTNRYQCDGRFKLTSNLIAGAEFAWEDSALPVPGEFDGGGLAATSIADERSHSSAYLQYLPGLHTSFAARAGTESKRNADREAYYTERHYGLHCTTPAGRGTTFLAGVSHREADLDLPAATSDWESETWNYDIALTGAGGPLESYRLSYRWQDATGTSGADFKGLGLEFRLKQYPLYIASWWRDRSTALAANQGSFDDAGINITYRIDFRRFDMPEL